MTTPAPGVNKDVANRCNHFLPKKKKNCKGIVVPGQKYCGNHLALYSSTAEKRLPCPYGNHTVAESKYKKHLEICQDRLLQQRQTSALHYAQACNIGPGPDHILPIAPPELANERGSVESLSARRLALAVATGPEAFKDLIQRIERAAEKINPTSSEILSVIEPLETKEYIESENSAANRRFSKKHAQQQASIAGNMQRVGLLPTSEAAVPKLSINDTVYVELGAGKGYLSFLLQHCFGVTSLALVDNGTFKIPADRAMRHLGDNFQRVRCDLADFNPRGLRNLSPIIEESSSQQQQQEEDGSSSTPTTRRRRQWVAVGKHLCGAATDYALRCCINDLKKHKTTNNNTIEDNSSSSLLLGLAIATCCHHRCSWRDFVGREILEQELGFSANDFELISWMTGWALCGHEAPAGAGLDDENSDLDEQDNEKRREEGDAVASPTKKTKKEAGVAQVVDNTTNKSNNNNISGVDIDTNSSWRPGKVYTRAQRIIIGQRCKQLLDGARLAWLKSQGLSGELVFYVQPEVSGENRLLLASTNV